MTEDRLQQECFIWFNNTLPTLRGLLFHVPNGGARDGREAKKLKSMGVYPGVSDFIFLYKGRAHLIELKAGSGRQSDKQAAWEKLVEVQGFEYYLVNSLIGFQKVINSIIGINEQR